jgi:hypothetical protein
MAYNSVTEDDGEVRTRPPDLGWRLIKDPPLLMAVAWGFLIGLFAGAIFFGIRCVRFSVRTTAPAS